MFDIGLGWMEMAVIAGLVLIVIGPKELPKVLRTMAHWMRKIQGLAREFQSGLDDMVREADLEDAKNAINKTKNFNVNKIIEEAVDPTGEISEEARNIEKTSREDPEKAKDKTDDGQSAEVKEAGKETDGIPETEAHDDGAGDENGHAKVIHHPAQVAPPHSLTPPQEPAAEPEIETAAPGSGDSSQKRA